MTVGDLRQSRGRYISRNSDPWPFAAWQRQQRINDIAMKGFHALDFIRERIICQPLSDCDFGLNPYVDDSRFILQKNLKHLMGKGRDRIRQQELKRKTGVAQSSISRMVNGQVGVRLDTLGPVAKYFGLQPWQLLVPNLDPANPPVVIMTEAERQLYRSLRAVLKDRAS